MCKLKLNESLSIITLFSLSLSLSFSLFLSVVQKNKSAYYVIHMKNIFKW